MRDLGLGWGVVAVVALLTAVAPAASRADDLGPLASECVGSACPALSAYPSPFNFGPVPTAWRGHDEAFNGLVLGAFTVPSSGGAESEGRLAIGGDFLPARGFSVGISGGGTFVVGPQNNFDNLIVRGAATGTNNPFVGTVATLGTTVTGLVRVGGAATGITFDMGVLTQNAGTTPADLGIDLDATFATLQAKSQCWSQQSATGTLVNEVNLGNGWVLVGDNASALQVFNLGAGDLDVAPQELNFRDIPAGATVLVNVGGATPIVSAARVNADTTGNPTLFNVLFNLYQATSASIPRDVNGSVLIPSGALDLGGSVNGRLLVGGNVIFSGSGQELHNYPFTGELPTCAAATETPTQTETPTATETPTQTETETATVTETETPVPTPTQTAPPTATDTAVPTATDTGVPTATDTAVPTATETGVPTSTETSAPTATGTAVPTATETSAPTATETSAPTATGTPVPSATGTSAPTATPTQFEDGQSCTRPSQCLSGFCVDGVCCDTACDGPNESCNEPGRAGECSPESVTAPAASPAALALAALTLLALAALRRAAR